MIHLHHTRLTYIARRPVYIHVRTYSDTAKADHRASSKLFQDAEKEELAEQEAQTRSERVDALYSKHDNWTGDENIQDAVLRMLVDKYKPLRTGSLRTADEKLKQAPPKIGPSSMSSELIGDEEVFIASSSSSHNPVQSGRVSGASMANVPLLPAIEGHQPWHTTFRVPSHSTSNIKYGNIPPPPKNTAPLSSLDEQARRKAKDAKKRSEQGLRLSRARESTLDYRLGIKNSTAQFRRPNPVSLKGWASLVEDRIEVSLELHTSSCSNMLYLTFI